MMSGGIPRLNEKQREEVLGHLEDHLSNPDDADAVVNAVDEALNNYAMARTARVDDWFKKAHRRRAAREIKSLGKSLDKLLFS